LIHFYKRMFLLALLLLMSDLNTSWGKKKADIIKELFDPAHYDPDTRPGEDENIGPSEIEVNLFVRDFQYIDIVKMEIGVQITFRQKWLDPRLQYTPPAENITYITLPTDQKIWKPDTFFRNEVSGGRHSILQENSYVRLFPDGHVLTSIRLTLGLRCPMNLRSYPFDLQNCPLQLASYGGHKENIVYVWKSQDPVQITRSLSLPDYTLNGFGQSYCDVLTSTGAYSCAQANFLLKRVASVKVLTVMVPSVMWIVVAWLALWVSRDQMLGRIFLVCLSIYALSEIAKQEQADVPNVAYTKAMDTWTGTCIMFAFIALVEVLLVGSLHSSVKAKEENGGQWRGPAFLHRLRSSPRSHKLEVAFRILNPLVFFILFIIPFFVSYSTGSKACSSSGNNTVWLSGGGADC